MDATALSRSPLSVLAGLLTLMRPKQWVKNTFVLAPLLFAGEFLLAASLERSLVAMLIFCLASSAVYIVNDLRDIERDRRHPVKAQKRPLASGQVSIFSALVLLAVLYSVLAGAWWVAPAVAYVAFLYIGLNIAYSWVLKHKPVWDIFTIAIGFVLRVYAGAMALSVPVSSWMFVTTLCLALYLAALKRRQEILSSGADGREVLEFYTPALIERYAEMAATGALLFYSLFVLTARPELVLSIPLVLFGLYRYWFLVESASAGESPTDTLLGDWQLLACGATWALLSAYSLWPSAVL